MSTTTDVSADCPDCQFPADQGHDVICPRAIAAERARAEAEAIAERARLDAEAWMRVEAQFIRKDENLASWVCNDCGNLVGDRQVHVDWHSRINAALSSASGGGSSYDDPHLAGYGSAPRTWGSWPR